MSKINGLSALILAGVGLAMVSCSSEDGGGVGENGEKLGPLRCAELGGSTALLLSKVTGNANKAQSGVGTKSLDSAGSYDENPLTAGLFNKVELQTSSGAKSLDSIPDNPERIRFYDVDNDTMGQSDDAEDYVFVFTGVKNRPFFLIRKSDNAVLYPDVRPLDISANGTYLYSPRVSARLALADSAGNVYIGGIETTSGGLPLFRVAAMDLAVAVPGAFVPVSVVSLDGDDGNINLLAADGENDLVAYELSGCNPGGCQSASRLVSVETGGFRDRPDEFPAFQLSGRAYAFDAQARTDQCGTYYAGTEDEFVYEVEGSALRLNRLGVADDTSVWEVPACVGLSTYSSVYYTYDSTAEFIPGVVLRWLDYSRVFVENDEYGSEDFSVPALVRESGLELLVEVGREITSRLENESFSSFSCAPDVCLGLSNGRAIGFNPNADDAAQVFEVDGISVRSLFPGETGVTFDGNQLSTGERVIGVVTAGGGFEVKAAIGTEIQQYVPLRKSNADPVACSTAG